MKAKVSKRALNLMLLISKQEPEKYTVAETAALFGLSEGLLNHWVTEQDIPSYDEFGGMSDLYWPAMWRAFSEISSIAAGMSSAFAHLESQARKGSAFKRYVNACYSCENGTNLSTMVHIQDWVANNRLRAEAR